MVISELILKLQDMMEEHGDLTVTVAHDDGEHGIFTFEPEVAAVDLDSHAPPEEHVADIVCALAPPGLICE